MTNRGGNAIQDRVSYDYPNGGTINAWDSPFDFVWKMVRQRTAIRTHFRGMFQLFNDPSAIQAGIFPRTANGNENNISPANAIPNTQLSQWNASIAPNQRWKYYWKEPFGDPAADNRSYLPGLGFWYHDRVNYTALGFNGADAQDGELSNIVFTNQASAGADCVGFAKRAAAYSGVTSQWASYNDFRSSSRVEMAGNVNPDSVPRANTVYWENKENYSDLLLSRMQISTNPLDRDRASFYSSDVGSDDGPSQEELENIKNIIKRIIPGDLIMYDSHIGIVDERNDVALNAAMSINRAFNALTIIESVYAQRIFYVFKRGISQGPRTKTNADPDGNNEEIIDRQKGNTWNFTGEDSFRDWEIRRVRYN